MKLPRSHRYKKSQLCIYLGCRHPKRSGGLCAAHHEQSKRGELLKPIVEAPKMHVQTSRISDAAKLVLMGRAKAERVSEYEVTSGILERALRASRVAR